MVEKKVVPATDPIEGGVCLYKDGGSHVFTQEEAAEALSDGWVDNPTDCAKKPRGRKPKVEEE